MDAKILINDKAAQIVIEAEKAGVSARDYCQILLDRIGSDIDIETEQYLDEDTGGNCSKEDVAKGLLTALDRIETLEAVGQIMCKASFK